MIRFKALLRAAFLRAAFLGAGLLASGLIGCSAPAPYSVSDDAIPVPLTNEPANAVRGKTLFSQRGDAHCVLCHAHENLTAEFPGTLGPDLTQVSERLDKGQIRLRIADYEQVKPGTTMPSYFRTNDLTDVSPEFEGKTVLTALEIEDIIAFLSGDDGD